MQCTPHRLYFFLLLLSCCFYSLPCYTHAISDNRICLNMIVKNEASIIKRCLASVKPLISYWIIVDTGSSDGTQAVIKEYMQDIPGELHERDWVDFAHNRSEALQLAKNKADYLLFIDADETLIFSEDFTLPQLHHDMYYVPMEFHGTKYSKALLVNNHLPWIWKGVLHEYVTCNQSISYDHLKGISNHVSSDGNRSKDPLKYQKDAAILEKALEEDPTNARYMFYLAQSYRDAEDFPHALKKYADRVNMGEWDQEVFWSMLQIGKIQELLNMEEKTVLDSYWNSYLYRPSRIEPLYYITHFHRCKENYVAGYNAARRALTTHESTDTLFVEQWIYDYGLMLEFSVCAYWCKQYTEALLASYLLLNRKNLPNNIREIIHANLEWIYPHLAAPNKN